MESDDLAVWTSAEKDDSNDWYILRSDGSFDFCHFLSAARSLVRCSRRISDNQGLEVKVEHKVSVASRDEKLVGDAREDRFREERVGLGLVEH